MTVMMKLIILIVYLIVISTHIRSKWATATNYALMIQPQALCLSNHQ